MVMVGEDGIVQILREARFERFVMPGKPCIGHIHIGELRVHLGVAGIEPFVDCEPAGFRCRSGLITFWGMPGAFSFNH